MIAIALSARWDMPLPGSPVPQSAQTLAVLLVGFALGARGGIAALAAYVAAGGFGLPVFADGASGWEHLLGPTAGYLLGFTIAAGLVGWLTQAGLVQRIVPALAIMVGGHAVILALGWLRLAAAIGPGPSYDQGVAPFFVGGLAKSLVAAVVVVAWGRYRNLRPGPVQPGASAAGRASL